MDDYDFEHCEPEKCPDCESENSTIIERKVIHPDSVHQMIECADCGYKWIEVLKVHIEIRFC